MADENTPQDRPIVTLAEARAIGLVRYFTGVPCKHGHLTERSTGDRQCCECKRIGYRKWASANSEKKKAIFRCWWTKNGSTRLEKNRQWKKNNPALTREHARRAYHKDIDKTHRKARESYRKHRRQRSKDGRAYYQKNKGDIKRAAREYYRLNSESAKQATKAWRARNRDKARKIARDWAARNPETLRAWAEANTDKIRIYAARTKSVRRLRIESDGNVFTKADIDRIFDDQKGRCAYCKMSIKGGYHIDHIRPLAKGGSNAPSNLQLTCADCNQRKHARDPLDFARSINLLL